MKRRDGKWRPNEGFMDVKVLFVASPSSCVLLYKNDARGEEGDPLKGKRERKKEKSGQQKRKKRSPRDRNVKRDAIVTTGDPFLDDNHLPLPPPPLPFCVDLKRETPQIFKWFPAQRWFKQREKVKDFLPSNMKIETRQQRERSEEDSGCRPPVRHVPLSRSPLSYWRIRIWRDPVRPSPPALSSLLSYFLPPPPQRRVLLLPANSFGRDFGAAAAASHASFNQLVVYNHLNGSCLGGASLHSWRPTFLVVKIPQSRRRRFNSSSQKKIIIK